MERDGGAGRLQSGGSFVDALGRVAAVVDLPAVTGAAQTLHELAVGQIERCELVSRGGFGSDDGTPSHNGEFNGHGAVSLAGIDFLGDFGIQPLNLVAELLNFGDLLFGVFAEPVLDCQVAAVDIEFHGALHIA